MLPMTAGSALKQKNDLLWIVTNRKGYVRVVTKVK